MGVCLRLLVIGLVVLLKALVLGFRCLKGLRRSNWANLLSVTFAVPLTTYNVEWNGPDGRIIRFRKDGEPVQGEPAFDPFAMMDEQDDSFETTVELRPVKMFVPSGDGNGKLVSNTRRTIEGPGTLVSAELDLMELRASEYIGCCGFPCLTGGYSGRVRVPSESQMGNHEVPEELYVCR